MLFLELVNLQVCSHLCVVDNLAISLLVRTLFINRFVQGNVSDEMMYGHIPFLSSYSNSRIQDTVRLAGGVTD